MGRGWLYKTLLKNGSLWSDVVLEKEVIFNEFDFVTLDLEFWGLEIKHLKAHNCVWKGCFFFHYYLATSKTNWAQIFTGLFFYAYVGIHQVRRVFDNYQ